MSDDESKTTIKRSALETLLDDLPESFERRRKIAAQLFGDTPPRSSSVSSDLSPQVETELSANRRVVIPDPESVLATDDRLTLTKLRSLKDQSGLSRSFRSELSSLLARVDLLELLDAYDPYKIPGRRLSQLNQALNSLHLNRNEWFSKYNNHAGVLHTTTTAEIVARTVWSLCKDDEGRALRLIEHWYGPWSRRTLNAVFFEEGPVGKSGEQPEVKTFSEMLISPISRIQESVEPEVKPRDVIHELAHELAMDILDLLAKDDGQSTRQPTSAELVNQGRASIPSSAQAPFSDDLRLPSAHTEHRTEYNLFQRAAREALRYGLTTGRIDAAMLTHQLQRWLPNDDQGQRDIPIAVRDALEFVSEKDAKTILGSPVTKTLEIWTRTWWANDPAWIIDVLVRWVRYDRGLHVIVYALRGSSAPSMTKAEAQSIEWMLNRATSVIDNRHSSVRKVLRDLARRVSRQFPQDPDEQRHSRREEENDTRGIRGRMPPKQRKRRRPK